MSLSQRPESESISSSSSYSRLEEKESRPISPPSQAIHIENNNNHRAEEISFFQRFIVDPENRGRAVYSANFLAFLGMDIYKWYVLSDYYSDQPTPPGEATESMIGLQALGGAAQNWIFYSAWSVALHLVVSWWQTRNHINIDDNLTHLDTHVRRISTSVASVDSKLDEVKESTNSIRSSLNNSGFFAPPRIEQEISNRIIGQVESAFSKPELKASLEECSAVFAIEQETFFGYELNSPSNRTLYFSVGQILSSFKDSSREDVEAKQVENCKKALNIIKNMGESFPQERGMAKLRKLDDIFSEARKQIVSSKEEGYESLNHPEKFVSLVQEKIKAKYPQQESRYSISSSLQSL